MSRAGVVVTPATAGADPPCVYLAPEPATPEDTKARGTCRDSGSRARTTSCSPGPFARRGNPGRRFRTGAAPRWGPATPTTRATCWRRSPRPSRTWVWTAPASTASPSRQAILIVSPVDGGAAAAPAVDGGLAAPPADGGGAAASAAPDAGGGAVSASAAGVLRWDARVPARTITNFGRAAGATVWEISRV
eukprot:jgi/Tetstr1/429579/TSEL_019479.t1